MTAECLNRVFGRRFKRSVVVRSDADSAYVHRAARRLAIVCGRSEENKKAMRMQPRHYIADLQTPRESDAEAILLIVDSLGARSRPLVHSAVAIDPDELHGRPEAVADEADADRRVCIDFEQILGEGSERRFGSQRAC